MMTLWNRIRGTLYLIPPMLLLIAALVLLGRAFYYVIPPISPYLLSYIKTYVALPAGLAVAALVYWVALTKRDSRLLHKIILGISIAAVVGTGVTVGLWALYQYNCVASLRPERDYYHCNFTGKDLSNRDMHGSDLTQALLGGTNLSGANLAGTNLRGQDLHAGMLSEADLKEAILAEAILTSADLRGVIAESADLTAADLSNADLRDCQLSKAKLNNATLEGTTLSGCDLSGADLSELDLSTASLKDVNLTGANLQGANLVNLDLKGVILDEADLQKANLTGSQLDGASLKNANLQDTLLTNTNLSRANLEQVLAQDADLSQAELRGANLTSANITGASLAGCHLQGATIAGADFSGSDLSMADLEGLDLRESQLTEAILVNANLTNANLSALDLRSVDLSGAVLIGANLEDANLSGSEYHDLQLQQAILSGADLSDARFEDCQFNQANLRGATLTDADLSGNDLTDVNLQTAVLSRTVLRETILEGANLNGLDLHSAVFSKTILKDADLEDADLSGRDLSGVNFGDSNLRNANLTESNLSFADLSNAKFQGADFSNCNLGEADLSDQDLTQVVITGAMLSGVDLSGASLTGLNLVGMDLQGADLTGADLHDADLRNADFSAADFKGALLEGALLARANFLDAANLSEEMVDAALGTVNGTRFQKRDAITAALSEVCQGKGVEAAASYDAASGLRPAVLLDKNGFSHMWSDYLPSTWEPTGIRFAQLVACVGPQESTVISSTPYCLGTSYCSNPTYLKRYRYKLEAEIRRAREGTVLAKQTFYGDAPRSVQRTESWSVVNTGLWGSDVFYSDIENWMKGIIAPRIFECKDAIGCVEVVPGAPLEIGVAFTFSGLYEYLGLDALRGIEIASEDIGDVLGHTIRLVEVDSMCSEEGGKEAGEYFVKDEWLVGAIGTTCGGATYEVSKVLSEAGRVLICPSISTAWLTDPAYHQDGFLRVIPNDLEQAKLVAEFAYRKLGARTMATIHEGSRYGGDLQALACETFSKLGGECLIQEETSASATDLYGDLTRIAEQSPDVLYFPVLVDTAASLVKEARKLDALADTDLIGSDNMFGQYFMENAGSAAKGIYLSGLLLGSEYYTSVYDGFLEKFNERYRKPPGGLFHAYAYDALLLLTNAIEKVAVKESNGTIHIPLQGLRDTLYNTRYLAGLTGQLNCNAQGDCGARNMLRILQIVNTDLTSFSPGSGEGDNPKVVYP